MGLKWLSQSMLCVSGLLKASGESASGLSGPVVLMDGWMKREGG